jgi:protocatechuate 3,4-dioxygenase beta subunit
MSDAGTGGFSRRRALGAAGTVGLGALLAACTSGRDGSTEVPTSEGSTATVQPSSPSGSGTDLFAESGSCTLTPEQTEGPYWFDVDSIRSDVREDREGARLRLAVRVQDLPECEPVANAVVEIWHCDATGLYSGFESASQGGAGGGRTDDETYLRGAQVTNADGIVQFLTVYPGWYRGRTVHIHMKVHLDAGKVLTCQLFFDDAVTDKVYRAEPYAGHGSRTTRNDDDSIMTSAGDNAAVVAVREDGDGYLGTITVGVDAP